ncbi:SCO1/SenC-domain-containing protein [Yarrowia lipolytica]|jgi:protein SCO1/2|uniref:YALI0E23045p n=2 Tax=Yarrowia lipolytica TaxID=4952 RepID=Q6C4X1_YARLI|nr:YALI0E23045p [Yarrowia lipolytica CLIB122]AOW05821.1 hypothetical protein YALI1_E27196g [Yarrowia lipolytica]KAB8285961.1 SCO1/SenC-domain-containing protein [Yarrowia lipolytica]KAE8172488.1 SCO1/SenC-domain-containing protein [Yarrowia lipolytica]KAJ8057267.1 SCO1/SenC-domain-containing protein [Yarrowia lipolytica]QNP99988.1 Protein SCO1 [Yarrowia lipolytica]|eukprot:XP_504291.1 YALI0E23045p [Yarrowia lipolytica CLIB122]
MLRTLTRLRLQPLQSAAIARPLTQPLLQKRWNSTQPPKDNEQQAAPASSEGDKPKRKPLSRISVSKGASPGEMHRRQYKGIFDFKVFALFVASGVGIYWFFQSEKAKVTQRREAEANRGYGKPLVGGPFVLQDHKGGIFSSEDLKGKFSLLYFGFSMCPDICPDELDKMAIMIDEVNKSNPGQLQPLFITCDPARDSPEVLEEYLSEFHPQILGLTGTYDEIKQTCKAYRVYFSTPPNVKPGQDYLVDHSIFFYLMDPEGQFLDVLGRNLTAEEAVAKIREDIKTWEPKAVRDRKSKGWFGSFFY